MKKIRVLCVDDSALMRKLLTGILNSDPAIEVIDTAEDAFSAREKIKKLNPDVLTLDIEMPKMDGITFLKNLMRLRPMPVLMVTTLTAHGASATLDALKYGAIDFVTKPKTETTAALNEYSKEVIFKVKIAACAHVSAYTESLVETAANTLVRPKSPSSLGIKVTNKLVAIGASTGGTEAIKDVLVNLPPDFPGTVITQHIPEAFSKSFAERMDRESSLTVAEAKDGDKILTGHAFIAPGSAHLSVVRDNVGYHCKLNDGPPVNRHRPSVDVLFNSVARCVGRNAIAVILTGMGNDGARGLKEILDAGGQTMVQDEKTSVVWGMPGSAVKLGAAQNVYPLPVIAQKMMDLLR